MMYAEHHVTLKGLMLTLMMDVGGWTVSVEITIGSVQLALSCTKIVDAVSLNSDTISSFREYRATLLSSSILRNTRLWLSVPFTLTYHSIVELSGNV